MIKILLDAFGGDNAPLSNIKGAIKALEKEKDIIIYLTGNEDILKEHLKDKEYDKERLKIVHTTEIIKNEEAPVLAIKTKKDSSIVKGLKMLKEKEVDAFISAGSTGAVLAGATLIVGRIKNVKRPALAPLIPTINGISLLIDCGANVDARKEHLVQFAKMGSIYMEKILGIKNPKIGLVNIGAEEEKGNSLVKEVFPLLKEENINFYGSVEARDIPKGVVDVIVCEAFVGNVILKLYEGLGLSFLKKIKNALMRNLFTKIGALFIKNSLKEEFKVFDLSEHGGAPLIGLKSLVIKAHGSASEKEICNSIIQAKKFKEAKIEELIEESFK